MLIAEFPLFLPPSLFLVTVISGRSTDWPMQYLRLVAGFLSYLLSNPHAMSSSCFGSFLGLPQTESWATVMSDFETKERETVIRSPFILSKMQKSLTKQPSTYDPSKLFKPGCARTRLVRIQFELEKLVDAFAKEDDVVKALTEIIDKDVPLSIRARFDSGKRWMVHQDCLAVMQKCLLLLVQESYICALSGPGPRKDDRNSLFTQLIPSSFSAGQRTPHLLIFVKVCKTKRIA